MPVPVSPDPAVVIGVGIDTSRYGHYVTFLNAQLQAAAPPLEVAESRAGYQQLHERFAQLHQHFPTAQFRIRLDAASNYATNLETFLRQLPFPKVLSVGEPTRNKRYRDVHFPGRKSDATESYAAARFAVVERPESSPECPEKLRALREIASRLEAQTRQTTRHVNQLHNLLARVFPELPLLTSTIDSSWVLQLLHKYPTPAKLAKARPASLEAIPYLPADKVQPLLEAARVSIASVTGPSAEVLIEGLVQQVRDCHRQELRLKKLLIALYEELPDNHLATIPGIGKTTAAVLTAKIASIERFNSPNQLVGYFGIFPELAAPALTRTANRAPHTKRTCANEATIWSAITSTWRPWLPFAIIPPPSLFTAAWPPKASRAIAPWATSCASSCTWSLLCGKRASPLTRPTTHGTCPNKNQPRAARRSCLQQIKRSPRLEPPR